MMKTLKFTIAPCGPFATPIQGDTLFGQMCWTIIRAESEAFLTALLNSYASMPFAVVSDAFPSGYIPKPSVPAVFLGGAAQDPKARKLLKRKQWIPLNAISSPLETWLDFAKSDSEILQEVKSQQTHLQTTQRHMHNSINRLTGTTGEAGFAPYVVEELWHADNVTWDIYVVVDEQKISQEKIHSYLARIGELGYGKDANVGAGRFVIQAVADVNFARQVNANAVLALANVAPQGLSLNPKGCFYQPFTRYGRHGDWAVLVNPYKAPILMAKTGAVLTPAQPHAHNYIGQALGGKGEISNTIPQTVHQGYAPVLHIHLPIKE